jgi:putative transposase
VARHPRSFGAGVYHVAAHGSSDRPLFVDDADRRAFLDLFEITWTRLGLEPISYLLMTNHYHTLTWTPDKRLSRALQILHGRYSFEHNKRHRRSAHLFRAHCFARRIRDDDDLLATERYVARNPVNAGIVLQPLDWGWGSTPAHAGLQPAAIPLSEQRLHGAFGGHASWRKQYANFVQPLNEKGPPERAFLIAGAGFEPATSGL